jgi:hypothetical protein
MSPAYSLALRSAEDHHPPEPRWPGLSAAERIVAKYWHMETSGHHIDLPTGISDKATATAYVNHGRWLVRCPWCPSAQNASRADHRFFCIACGNAAVSGQWVPVIWPAEHREIEELLMARPHKQHQNWEPHETAAGLRDENVAHGIAS